MSSVLEIQVKIIYRTCYLVCLRCCKVIWLWIVSVVLLVFHDTCLLFKL